MAEEKDKILYEFYGDITSLRSATTEALSLLDKFQQKMDNANSEGIVKASKRAQSGFNNSINQMKKNLEGLRQKLSTVGDVKVPTGGAAFNTLQGTASTLGDTLTRLTFTNNITSKSLNAMRDGLRTTNESLKTAAPSFDKLISSEERFQQKTAQISAVATKVSSALSATFAKISGHFDPMAVKMQGLKDKASVAGQRITTIFQTVAAAFRRTSTSADAADASIKKVEGSSAKATESGKNQNKQLQKTSEGFSSMKQAASAAAKAIESGIKSLGKSLDTIKNSVLSVTDAFFALAGVDVGSMLADASKGAIDYVENLNLFEVAMGDSVEVGKKFVNQMQEVYGMDPSNVMRYAGYFYQLTDAIGMSSDASTTLSLSMTKAANDLSSLFNVNVETVVNDLSSGMMGMSRTVRKYGMDIRATTIQQTAYKYGLKENVEQMSEANRQALRYITMLEQAQNALKQTTKDTKGATKEMGDFARNIETPANQLRIFKEQMSQLGRAIGTFIVAPLQKVLPYINGFVMALRTAITFISALLGVSVDAGSSLSGAGESADNAADGIGGIGGAADDAAKKLKKLTAPFDELNVLSEESADSGGSGIASDVLDPKLQAALENMSLKLEDITMKANKVRDSLLAAFGFKINADGEIEWSKDLFKESLIKMFPQWEKTIEEAFKSWDASGFGQLAGVVISGSLEKFTEFIKWENIGAKVTEVITTLQTFINSAINTIDGESVGQALGETLNTVIQTSLTFISGFDWSALGTLLATSINSTFATIDWTSVGESLVALPNAIFTALSTLTAELDWSMIGSNLGTSITTMFETLDYNAFMQTVVNSIIGSMELLNELLPALLEAGASMLNGLAQGFEDNFPTFIEKLPSLIQGLVDGITESLPKFTEAALNLITTLANGIIDALPTLIASIPVIIEGLIDTILESTPLIMDAGVQLITKLFDNFDDIILPLINAIGNIIGQLISAILALIPDIARTGVDLLVSLVGSIPEIVIALVAALPALIEGLIEGLLAHTPEIAESGIKLIGSLVMSVPEIIWELVKAVPDIIKGLVDAFTSKESMGDIGGAGKDLIKGLWQGIKDSAKWFKDKVSDFVDGVISDIKGWFGIKSPSTVMADMGVNLIKGLWNGIKDTAKWLKDKISGFVDGVVDNIKGFFGIHSPSKETYWMGEMLTKGLGNAIEDTAKVVLKATNAMCDDISASLGSISTDVEAAQKALGSMDAKVITQVGTSIAPITSPTKGTLNNAAFGDSFKHLSDSNESQQASNNPGATNTDSTPMEVRVFIGDREYDAYTYKASERGRKIVGKQPIKIGG